MLSAKIEASLTAAVDLVNGLAARADAGDPLAASHAGIAKLTGTRAAIGAVEQAVALVGNNGLTRRYPLERHYRTSFAPGSTHRRTIPS